MKQTLVRFDVRLEKDDYVEAFWDREHRNRFLLKSDIEWPLSIDPLVWPSVFYSEIFREASKLPYGSVEVPPSTDDGQYWRNLAEMRSHYEKYKKPNSTKGVPVALQINSENGQNTDELMLTLGNSTRPAEPPAKSEFLGFDVADLSGISALCNCEYSREEKERLAPIWVPRLNAFGLLTAVDHAVEFRRLSDNRVAEHSPFWVYGIWRVPLSG